MKTSRLLLLAALGGAIALLLTTDKGKKIRRDVADNAEDWKDQLAKLANRSGDKLAGIRKMVSKEVNGLSEDAREQINRLLEEGTDSAKKAKKAVSNHM